MATLPPGYERHTTRLPGGAAVDWLQAGAGDIVVHLHGAGGPKISPAFRSASAGLRVIAPIYPGFEGTPLSGEAIDARSLAGLLGRFIAVTTDGPCQVVAHSLGGHVALWMALQFPQVVRAMLLQCAAGFRTGERPQGDPGKLLYKYPERIPDEPQYRSVHAAANAQAAKRYRADGFDQDLWDALPAIRCPVLLLHGEDDRLLDPAVSSRLAARLPDARVTNIPDAGHGVEVDQPLAFAQIAREHLLPSQRKPSR